MVMKRLKHGHNRSTALANRRRVTVLRSGVATVLFQAMQLARGRAEDQVDYKFEAYDEPGGRIQVLTHSAFFEKSLGSAVTARGEFVYDSISGATPTGGPPPTGSDQVPLAHMSDIRWAGNLGASIQWGRNTTTPLVAYSTESDYQSIGIALNHTLDFNQKNTTLAFGLAHDFDTIEPSFWTESKDKGNTDVLLGLTQLLGPGTLLFANLTVGAADGYLADPYRGFRFDDYPDPTALFPEKRPGYKNKQVLYLGLTQHVDPLNASVEASYRFYHDSFGILSHTVSLEWFQKVGSHLIVAPVFRYYHQTAAGFYAVQLPGDPTIPPDDPFFTTPTPDYYSADYRLSRMDTFTYGLSATVIIKKHLYLDAAYKRYDLRGLDGVTSASAYPDANVFTIGARLCF